MDESSGLCEGCMRSLDEIAAWGGLDAVARRQIWLRLPQRRVAWRRRRSDGDPAPDESSPP